MYPSKLFTISHKNSILGFNHKSRYYIVGFQKQEHLKLVKKTLSLKTMNNINILRNNTSDISDDVNKVLDTELFDLTIDVHAHLIFPKYNEDVIRTEIDTIDFQDFLMLPFSKNIGVTIPFEIIEDNGHNIIFESQIVDPCQDVKIFQKNLINL